MIDRTTGISAASLLRSLAAEMAVAEANALP
jgi:hypothetical protein